MKPARSFLAFSTVAPLAVLTVAAFVAPACGGAARPPEVPVNPSVPSASPSAAPDTAASSEPLAAPTPSASASASAMPMQCGCSLCAPVFSEDACKKDSDCAPETPCHATRCVARAKATPRTPGTVCTMMMRCDSTDANGCGCREGRCALYPRK